MSKTIPTSEFRIQSLREASPAYNRALLDTPEAVRNYLREELPKSERFTTAEEMAIVVFLNTRRRCIGHSIVAIGVSDCVLMHPSQVFRAAILAGANSIVLAHNHPSGDPSPSEGDIRCTRDFIQAGKTLKIEVVDHVILGDLCDGRQKDYCSLRELGYFYS